MLPWLTKLGPPVRDPVSCQACRTVACTVDARWSAAVHVVAGLVHARYHFVSCANSSRVDEWAVASAGYRSSDGKARMSVWHDQKARTDAATRT